MEMHWSLGSLLLTSLVVASFGSGSKTVVAAPGEDLCVTVTRTTSPTAETDLCKPSSTTRPFFYGRLSSPRNKTSILTILQRIEVIRSSHFIFVDQTLTNASIHCFDVYVFNLELLPFIRCEQVDLPVVCLSSCSKVVKWNEAPGLELNSKFIKKYVDTEDMVRKENRKVGRSVISPRDIVNERYGPVNLLARDSREIESMSYDDSDLNRKVGKSVMSPRNSVNERYNPVNLLAGDSREIESMSYEDNDLNLFDEPKAPIKEGDDVTIIYNAEHDLNAMTIGRNNNVNLHEAVGILDNVLSLDRGALLMRRTSVKNILLSFDRAVDMAAVRQDSNVASEAPRVAVMVTDTRGVRRVSGLALSSSGPVSGLLHMGCLKELTGDVSVNQLANRKDIDGAILLPSSLRTKTRTGFTVFAQDNLFHSVKNSSHQVNSRVMGLRLHSELYYDKVPNNEYVYIIFRPKSTALENRRCAFWNFSAGGHWSSSGCELLQTSDSGLDICRCNHATHFAEIITDADADGHGSAVLDVVSIVGCTLSLLGVLGIAVTAVLFKQWRSELGNKFLLHLASAIALNMSVFLAVALGGSAHSSSGCILLGVLLHYSLLASFSWMLVSALLQFLRLVIVFTSRGSHLLLKCAVFAWGAPLIPVLVLLAINPHLYTNEGRDFCYPRGLPFYTAVLGPIALIVTNNMIAYIAILYNIYPCCRNSRDKSFIRNRIQDRSYVLRCFWLSILLFFLFGLTWIFGFLAKSTLFAYMFCIFATLQGFVLFIFFILGEKKVRKQWTEKTVSTDRRTRTTYLLPSNGTSGSYGARTTISSDGRVETSFDF